MAKRVFSRKITFITLLIVLGTGTWVSTILFADTVDTLKKQLHKLQLVISFTNSFYVEDVDWDKAMSGAIKGMLEELDPHSIYIDKKAAKANEEDFGGKYEGIGIQFDVIDRLITVVGVIVGSPAQKVGLESGDKIVRIDGESSVGISRDDVPKKLKGPAGTMVHVSIRRDNFDELLEFDIERAAIPLNSVYATFMWDDKTGYIKLTRFMATTGEEIEESLNTLERQGMQRLILDLRGNPGGYLNEAVKVAGKFLPGHQKVVFTKNRSGKVVSELYSDTFSKEKTRKVPVIIMIDKNSASASEIVSGAIQDYDRGLIVGENSFGKGLVQKEFDLRDGSKLRLTTAKYYIPSGRLIQKKYKGKNKMEYYMNQASSDSVAADSTNRPVFTTIRKGRNVYGGGGIHPDIVLDDSNVYTKEPKLAAKLNSKRIFFEVGRQLINEGRIKYTTHVDFIKKFKFTNDIMQKVIAEAEANDINFDEEVYKNDLEFIKYRLIFEIVRSKYGIDEMWEVIGRVDKDIEIAVSHFPEAENLASDYPFK